MNILLESILTLLIPTLILLHLYLSPYTKVEESFNLQATHDILTYGIPTKNVGQRLTAEYDHVSFPGSVPRTFVGALVLAGLSKPWVRWVTAPEQMQMLVRGILGLFNSIALLSFRNAVKKGFGKVAGNWYILLQASQFHVIYYASRSLPNMLAFGLTTLALRSLILASLTPGDFATNGKRQRLALYLLTISGIVFRSEIAILLATQTLYLLLRGRTSFTRDIIPAGIAGTVIGLTTTVLVDSFFWQRFPLWPEWIGFYYNTILGRSADWGTSPWYFYFVNALPRLLVNPMTWAICIPLAVIMPSTRQRSLDVLIPQLSFVALYSLLPHKEWRFIIYVLPGLTAVAAIGASYIWIRRSKSPVFRLLSLALVCSTLGSFIVSSLLLGISSLNYPGGEALTRLHALAHGSKAVIAVHMDDLACQTGVTRFLQKPPPESALLGATTSKEAQTLWLYDKTEDQRKLLDPLFWQRFDYVLAERPEKVVGKWEVVDTVYGFAGIGVARPGEEGGKVETGVQAGLISSDNAELAGSASGLHTLWAGVADTLRKSVTRGWWIKVKMEPKIRILKRQDIMS